MNFVNYKQFHKDILNWSQQLDQDYDAVIGVPRSGMLVASILALHWNIKLGDLGGLTIGTFFEGGHRDKERTIKKVLVVDDSINTGKSIAKAKKLCRGSPFEIHYGAPYVKGNMRSWLHYKVLPCYQDIHRRCCLNVDDYDLQRQYYFHLSLPTNEFRF